MHISTRHSVMRSQLRVGAAASRHSQAFVSKWSSRIASEVALSNESGSVFTVAGTSEVVSVPKTNQNLRRKTLRLKCWTTPVGSVKAKSTLPRRTDPVGSLAHRTATLLPLAGGSCHPFWSEK